MKPRRPRGAARAAEDLAARHLESLGYRIERRNATTRAGEIDIVCREGEVLCFCEVKMRRSARSGRPEEFVGRRKQARLARAARIWLARHPHDGPRRFDVVAITGDPADDPEIRLIRNAFWVDG